MEKRETMCPFVGSAERQMELRTRVTNRFIKVLRRSGDLGFLGGMPIAEQVDHALGFAFAVEESLQGPPPNLLDLGTGGGLPGLVLIACWPQAEITLVDASERRTDFLQGEIARLPGGNLVKVIRGRAEELGRITDLRERFSVVVCRSFGTPAVTAECSSAFVGASGIVVVSEPPEVSESRWPDQGLRKVGLARDEYVRFADRYGYQVLKKTARLEGMFPRRNGIPAKRPIF
jgi:16S rRNA (guanine527-N7)-methyltransferase